MDDSGPYKQAYCGDDRREDYGAYKPPKPDVPPNPDQLEQTPEYRGHLIADDREDQWVNEVPLAEYAAEEAHGLQDDPTHGGDEGLYGVGVAKLGASGATGRP